MRTRWIVAIVVAAGFVALPVMAFLGWAAYTVVTTPLAPAVEGCPSHALPVHPGSRLHNYAQITLGSDQGGMTTGCWAEYEEPALSSVHEVFSFYAEPRNVPGWMLDEADSNTGYLSFRSTAVPGLRADIGIASLKRYFAYGPESVTYSISVCLCDPREMAQ
jgi:hypothetical protein